MSNELRELPTLHFVKLSPDANKPRFRLRPPASLVYWLIMVFRSWKHERVPLSTFSQLVLQVSERLTEFQARATTKLAALATWEPDSGYTLAFTGRFVRNGAKSQTERKRSNGVMFTFLSKKNEQSWAKGLI